jgi:hypothetical protein
VLNSWSTKISVPGNSACCASFSSCINSSSRRFIFVSSFLILRSTCLIRFSSWRRFISSLSPRSSLWLFMPIVGIRLHFLCGDAASSTPMRCGDSKSILVRTIVLAFPADRVPGAETVEVCPCLRRI